MFNHPTTGLRLRGPLSSDLETLSDLSKNTWDNVGDSYSELADAIDNDHNSIIVAAKGSEPRGYIRSKVNKEESVVEILDFDAEEPEISEMLLDKLCRSSKEIKDGFTIRLNRFSSNAEKLGFQKDDLSNTMTMRKPYTGQLTSWNNTVNEIAPSRPQPKPSAAHALKQ